MLIQPQFFVSRAGGDTAIAGAIGQIIAEAGYKTWLQDDDFGHASFLAQMEEGLNSGARIIALLSSDYQASPYCRKEYLGALVGDPLNLKQRLIVLRITECEPTGLLRDISYTDIVPVLAMEDGEQRAALFKRIIRVLIGAELSASEFDYAALYRRAPQQILHTQINAVPGFTGREDVLAAIKEAFSAKSSPAAWGQGRPTAVALTGLGGVGKSVLARHFAWQERGSYRGIWWVRAEINETLLDDLVSLGARLGVPEIESIPDRVEAARLALQRLEAAQHDRPWLLIYDNVVSPAQIDTLTPRQNADVVITTRWPDWYGRAIDLPIDVFRRETAVAFLLDQARGKETRPAETIAEAEQLAEDVGNLPLALAIARTHAWGMNWTLGQYREHLAEMLARTPSHNLEYPQSIAATFGLAIERAKATSPEAETLLSLVSFLSPDSIPLDLISDDVLTEIEKGEAVAALAEVSLVRPVFLEDGTPGISVHRLVQTAMRWRLGGTWEQVASVAILLLDQALAYSDSTNHKDWAVYQKLERHCLAATAVSVDNEETKLLMAGLCNKLGLYLHSRAAWAPAELLYRRALAIREASLGPDHPAVTTSLGNLASLLCETNRNTEAEPLFRRALAIREASLGPDHPDVALRLNNLAALFSATN